MLTSELKGNRTLATVLFTDCVGFSARMSVNEEHTLDLIRRDLQLMSTICTTYEGRVLKSTGDGLLMCFSSAVKAVECAIAIQKEMAEAMRTLPPSDTLMHRIGIHLADMYITSTDVMGNGVNIAARLQTEADPGGICISQTVFDVAKHGLQLETEYLGPRELKNIREVVPAYRIVLEPDNFLSDPYTETARLLEQSGNGSRIRKLIFYICKNHWEQDESKLSTLSLKGIIHEFLGLASSYEQLRGLLNSAVGTLSKQSEYTLVANEILKGVAKFYPPSQSLQLWQGQLPPAAEDNSTLAINSLGPSDARCQEVAQALEQHPDTLRLKKLLYYICRRQWESEPARLQATSTVQLLQDVRSLTNDVYQLKRLVEKFVQTLNKRIEYSLVGTTLVGLLGKLYDTEPAESSEPDVSLAFDLTTALHVSEIDKFAPLKANEPPQTYAAIATALEQHPHSLRIRKLMFYLCKSQWVKDLAQLDTFPTVALLEELHHLAPTINHLGQVLNTVVASLSKQAEYGAIAQLLMQAMHPLYQDLTPTKSTSPIDTASITSEPSEQAPVSLFDVRLGILKYANPLKAKILAFSALHSDFSFTDQDWFNLKTYELDGLLRNLLRTCQNYTDLENLLYRTARRLQQPDELIQTADTVIKYLRAYYLHGRPALGVDLASTDATRISLDDFEAATQGFANLDEDEQTRGLAPAPPTPAEYYGR